MLASVAAVTIVVNGAVVAGVRPARLAGGRVVAPLTPLVVRLATRVSYDRTSGTVSVERGRVRISIPVAFTENDEPYVAVAPLVRGLGGTLAFDAVTKTLAIDLRETTPIATPAPYDPRSPGVQPRTVFTPAPPPPTPRVAPSGQFAPRRTAIPAVPSQPVPPEPATSPRQRGS